MKVGVKKLDSCFPRNDDLPPSPLRGDIVIPGVFLSESEFPELLNFQNFLTEGHSGADRNPDPTRPPLGKGRSREKDELTDVSEFKPLKG
jgi:hypothetical protein